MSNLKRSIVRCADEYLHQPQMWTLASRGFTKIVVEQRAGVIPLEALQSRPGVVPPPAW